MRAAKPAQPANTYTRYDPALLPDGAEWLFSPAALERQGLLEGRTAGRRSAFLFRFGDRAFVLRHFWRGGLVARVLDDAYLWTGLSRSRPVREWCLLQTLSEEGFPVPQPAALRLARSGLIYRADLITVRLPQVRTLADCLGHAPLEPSVWHRIGATVAALHARGAYHADLNARNIVLGHGGQSIFLIDWDRGRLRRPDGAWQARNLQRLRRSLNKLAGLISPFHYRQDDFDELCEGYSRILSRRSSLSRSD